MPPPDHSDPELPPGTRLGPYVVERLIGAGGMGQVYRGRDENLHRAVAIKLLPARFSDDPKRLRRFEQEARLAGALSHPNVVGVHYLGRHEGYPFIVTELLEGQTLRDRLRGRYLTVASALGIARQLTDGLAAAHAKGIVHRDLKPSNVFLCVDGPVKILDFGVAKLVQRDPQTGEPITGWTTEALPGTVGYMAPEQAHGHRIDNRADIFAMGSVLYEMLSGRKAFPGASPADVLVATLSKEPPELGTVSRDVPPALARVVHCCLSKEPDDRYSTVHDLRLALDSAEAQLARARWWPRVRVSRSARRKASIALAVALVTSGAWWLWPRLASSDLPSFEPRQVTSGAGLEQGPVLSPDGGFIAYASDQGGSSDVWIVDVQGGGTLQRTFHPARDEGPTWFPDSSAVLFVSDRDGEPGIWRVSRLGGQPRLLLPNAQDPAVSPDGRRLAFTRPDARGYRRLAVAPLDDLEAVRFLSKEALLHDERPVWSPDGRSICFSDFNHLWMVDADRGGPHRLTDDDEVEVEAAWSPDGSFIYFSSIREGIRGIWRRTAKGTQLTPVSRGPGEKRWPSLSRDGRRLAYASVTLHETLVAVDTRTGQRSRFEEAWRTVGPTVSPDGSTVVFVSTRDNRVDLWRLPLNPEPLRGEPERLTDQEGRISWPLFSRDGAWIAYHRGIEGQRDVWIMPADGGPGRRFTDDPGQDTSPAWSPDDSRIAFISDRGGSEEVWVAPVRQGRRAGEPSRVAGPVSDWGLAWSPDGRELAYIAAADGVPEVWVTPVDASGASRQLTEGARAEDVHWRARDGRIVIMGAWDGRASTLRTLDPATGDLAPHPDGTPSDPFSTIGGFDVTPDGRWLILLEESHRGDVWLLEAEEGRF